MKSTSYKALNEAVSQPPTYIILLRSDVQLITENFYLCSYSSAGVRRPSFILRQEVKHMYSLTINVINNGQKSCRFHFMNSVCSFICFGRPQISNPFHIFEWLTSYLYIVILSCNLVERYEHAPLLLLELLASRCPIELLYYSLLYFMFSLTKSPVTFVK